MNYALIENGIVINTIIWDGEAPITFPDAVEAINVPEGVTCGIDYTATENGDGSWTFTPPPAPPVVPPTPQEVLAANTATRNGLLVAAGLAMAPLQDAVDLGEANASETLLLTQWRQFRVAVNRVDLTQATPSWPIAPQSGYGASVSPAESLS